MHLSILEELLTASKEARPKTFVTKLIFMKQILFLQEEQIKFLEVILLLLLRRQYFDEKTWHEIEVCFFDFSEVFKQLFKVISLLQRN